MTTGSRKMRQATVIRREYKRVCQALRELHGKSGPSATNHELYMRLATIKNTLEWVNPKLVKPKIAAGARHIVAGPTHAELYP